MSLAGTTILYVSLNAAKATHTSIHEVFTCREDVSNIWWNQSVRNVWGYMDVQPDDNTSVYDEYNMR